jgi:hypothetical protein
MRVVYLRIPDVCLGACRLVMWGPGHLFGRFRVGLSRVVHPFVPHLLFSEPLVASSGPFDPGRCTYLAAGGVPHGAGVA